MGGLLQGKSQTRMRRIERTERIRSATIQAAYPHQGKTTANSKDQEEQQLQVQQQQALETPLVSSARSDAASWFSSVPSAFQKSLLLSFSCCLLVLSLAVASWLLSFLGSVRVRRPDARGADPLCPPSPPHPRLAVFQKPHRRRPIARTTERRLLIVALDCTGARRAPRVVTDKNRPPADFPWHSARPDR